jgi:ABC-type glycerol-3-phosphate transport system permease component
LAVTDMSRTEGHAASHRRSYSSIILSYVPLIVVSLLVLVPLIWMISTSFKGRQEFYSATATLVPLHPTLINYRYVLTQLGYLPIYLRNSFIVTFGAVLIIAVLSSLAAYAFARMRFRGRDFIFLALILSIFIPNVGGLMSLYELMSFLHLRNSLIGLILYFGSALPVPIFIMRQGFLAVPRELEEAALVDGASWFRVFISIALPIAFNALILVMILTFVAVWGDFLVTFILVDQDANMTISVGAQKVLVMPYATTITPGFAGLFTTEAANAAILLLASIPVVLVYLVLQRWFMRGLTEGALKF